MTLIPFNIMIQNHATISAEYDAASKAIKAVKGVGSGPMGLTPDAVKATPEFKEASGRYKRAHELLRKYNAYLNKHYKREWRDWQHAQIAARRAIRAGV